MLMSVDGKISTGNTDNLDVDKDFPKIKGIKEGLQQYYDIEQTTDLYSLNSGRVQAKVGVNKPQKNIVKLPVSFLIIDNQPHLNEIGVDNFIKKSKKLFIITTNKAHPAFDRKDEENLEIIYYENEIDFVDLFRKLKEDFKIDNLTIQTGATLNSIFLRHKLIDKLSIVVAPALVGGKETPSLIDGKSLSSVNELKDIKALKLVDVKKLNDSYLHLKYNVINETIID
ncbi:MAG: RibD domain protein [Candidatus Uhrbacteria bacterium GW2011_GWD1_41_16]|nr:MAG: RibD domain protein [Candidatus Uhrbacteria bacterium GW2011_GWD1_41_16]KKS17956.1 MAG: RibD domain protein [Candidatus Uhrbacteria bacterium GW2011_GWB1_41_7]